MTRNGLIWLLCVMFLSGCASTSVFVPYPAQMTHTKQEIASAQYHRVQNALAKKRQSADGMLYMMERGRVSFLADDIESSIQDYELVISALEEKEEKAKVTVSGALNKGASLLTNENAIPYAGEGYERIFVHHYQALNFLFKHQLESAGVEVRRANLEQELALKKYEDEVDEALSGKQEKNILENNQDYLARYEAMSRLAGSVKNSFQNAYTFYVSALIYEALGEFNSALIDYKKALEIFPDNPYIVADVARLAKGLAMNEDYERLKHKAKPSLLAVPNAQEGKLVVLYEYDYVSEKKEIRLPFSANNQIQMLTLPIYDNAIRFVPKLNVMNEGQSLAQTEKIVDVSALAAKALNEKIPMTIVRQLSRMVLRQQFRDEGQRNLFAAVASIGHLLLNRADLRSWLTLPREAQIAYSGLKVGEHEINLKVAGQTSKVPVSIRSGKTTIIYVHLANKRFVTKVVNL